MPVAVALTGWYIGFAIAALVIAIVVALVATILRLARRIGIQALAVDEQLELSRGATNCIGDVPKVNAGLKDIAECCIAARGVLEAKFG
jgi:hypothetical protein